MFRYYFEIASGYDFSESCSDSHSSSGCSCFFCSKCKPKLRNCERHFGYVILFWFFSLFFSASRYNKTLRICGGASRSRVGCAEGRRRQSVRAPTLSLHRLLLDSVLGAHAFLGSAAECSMSANLGYAQSIVFLILLDIPVVESLGVFCPTKLEESTSSGSRKGMSA